MNKQWPCLAYLICAVCQNVWLTSFLSTSIKPLIPLTDVLTVLPKYGVPQLLIANVVQFYMGTSAVVAMAYENAEKLSTISGVPQADMLTPFLFMTLLDCILHEMLLYNIDGFTITLQKSTCCPAV